MEKSSELLKECTEKIKVSSAEIVVHGTREKPYYEIKYHDLSDRQTHVGYSSYNLDFVFEWLEECFEIINQAADTIEALSAKLQAANMEQPSQHYENDIFAKIITALDERIGAEWRIIAGLNDETQIYGCTRSLEAYQQSKLIVEQNIEEYKEKQSETDYGSGWIPCKRKMPEVGKPVLVCDKQGNVCIRAVTCKIRGKKHWSQCKNDVIAWRELPEPYHQQQ